jgi:methionyl aminopeptidase
MIIIKNETQIQGIKKASVIAANTLIYLEQFLHIGQDTETLNELAHKYIKSQNCIPAPLNYHGFPKSICTSINNVVCHGIPDKKDILKNGDIVNIDITVIYEGYFGDTSKTYIIGEADEDIKNFVKITEDSMYAGIKILKPGILLSEMGKTIEKFVEPFNYSVVKEYGGHGVGIRFHEEPHVCHFYTKSNNIKLQTGMIFTVEPMINKSKNWRVHTSSIDGWTVTTKDNSLSAQFEHTVLITKDSYEILTLPSI